MKFALHTVSYAGCWKGQFGMPLEGAIEKAARLGYNGVEIMAKRPHASVLDMSAERVKRVKALLDDKGLSCACIAGYTDFLLGIDSMLVPSIEMQVSHVQQLGEMACALGGNLVRVFTGYEVPGHQYWPQWYMVVEALRECARKLAPMGVTLGLQNHHDIGADPEGMIDLLQDIGEPNVKAMYDAWTPALHGDDLAIAARRLAPHMAYTTVADYVRMPRWHYEPSLTNFSRDQDMVKAVPMGEGFIDYKTYFKALRNAGYDGWVSYEMCSPVRGGGTEANLDYCAGKFLEYMAAI